MPLESHLYTEGPRLSDFLLAEVLRDWTRESVILAPSTVDLPIGTVLALNATGAYVPYMTDLTESTAADKATAVLIQKISVNTNEQLVVAVTRGCVLAKTHLYFVPGVTDTEKNTAIADLKALGIVCKE